MSPTPREVVVTGLGAVTPLAGSAHDTWTALLEGTSGASPLPEEWQEQYALPVTFAAQVTADLSDVISRVESKRMDTVTQYALASSRAAWEDAGAPQVDPLRLGVSFGTGIGGVVTVMNQWDILKEKGTRRVSPLTVPMLMPNAGAAAVSLDLTARAGAHTPVSACASGAEAVAQGLGMIRRGEADVVVVGGAEACVHPMPIAGFAQMQALSRRNDSPTTASRPYDVDRDGFLLAEGAGALVLESAEHAAARSARVYARVLGAGLTADAHHIAAPEPNGHGAARAMASAVTDARAAGHDVSVRDVRHINAHATSTPVGDIAEGQAIRRAFGDETDHMAVSATKSLTGHLLGGAGAVESVFTVLALHHGLAPATANIENLDPDIPLDVVHHEHRALPTSGIVALNNSFGFGGHNAAIAFGSAR